MKKRSPGDFASLHLRLFNLIAREKMTTITIELPEALKDSIEQRLALSACETVEEYILKLIRDDKQRQLDEYYRQEVQKGLDSGDPQPMDEAFWERMRDRMRRHREETRQTVEAR